MNVRRGLFWVGVAYLVALVFLAVVGPLLRHDPTVKVGAPFLPASAQFWLGTDEQGRDIFARLAYGARLSLTVGLSVQLIAVVVGVTVGVFGVFGPRWARQLVLRITDGMFAFPDILLAILILGVWNLGLIPVITALAITAWPSVVRLTVAQVNALKDREFVVAARALGAPTSWVVIRHILPHLAGVLLAVSMVDVAGVILAESALSFLGIGVQPPTPSWGGMINAARQDMNSHPTMLIWPCLLLSLTVFALNFVGDGLRALSDPHRR